jgi:hypothetical protein
LEPSLAGAHGFRVRKSRQVVLVIGANSHAI